MNELHAILDAWRGWDGGHRKGVLATVVHVSGSAYRRPGARMLIGSDGLRIGSVSGGCLEAELAKRAWWLTESEQPALRVYDTTSDDDAVWEFGLGCNGVVQVLLERVESATLDPALRFLDSHRHEPVVVATAVSGAAFPTGSRAFFDGRSVTGTSALASEVGREIRAAFDERKSRFVHVLGSGVFVEWVAPPQRLVVFGAGHDARPLVTIAKQMGWNVTVADGRPAYACAANFPDADRVVLFHGADPLEGVWIDEDTVVVLATHNYPLDLRLLPPILARQPRYVGVLGPRSRAERLFGELGIRQPESVHGPTGLDLGGETPASVALSILSEIEATLNGRAGGFLRQRVGSIHAAMEETGTAFPLTAPPQAAYCEFHV